MHLSADTEGNCRMAARVWDQFLTDADRAHLAAARPKKPYGLGRRVAVLSVDNYRAAVGDRPEPLIEAIKTWPNSTGPAAWEALDNIATLLAAARAAGLPVIHVTGLAEEESGIPGWSARRHPRRPFTDAAAEDRHRRRYDIVEQAAPLPGEVVLRKTAPSAFFGTPLLAHLMASGLDTLIVVGEAVSGCVRASVVDGCSYRLNMIVVEECVYDRHEAARAMNLFDIDQKYGDVISLEGALAWIARQAPDAPPAEPRHGHQHVHGHAQERGQAHAHGHASGAGQEPRHEHGDDDAVVTTIPARVLAMLPAGARPVSAIWHPVHGQVLRRSGGEVAEAARAEIAKAFGGVPHFIAELRDCEPGDPAELRAAVAQTADGLVMIGIGYEAASAANGAQEASAVHEAAAAHDRQGAAEGSPASRSAVEGRAAQADDGAGGARGFNEECPECGAIGVAGERVTRSNGEVASLQVCPDCGAAWEAEG
jgi:maleamate amidohydrolase